MTSSVREAFARGYALATASRPVPLTERARRACLAAERVAEGAPAPDNVPSLLLGQLEGIWATIYDRREAIERLHAGAFKNVMKALAKLDWAAIVQTIETERLIDPSITGQMLARELRSRVSSMITAELPAEDRAAWHSVMSEALVDGMAEGHVAAQAILDHPSVAGFDWELAGEEAKAALGRGTALADTADLWVQRQTQGLGYQVSQRLVALWDAGATRAEMEAAIQEILGSSDNVAATLLDDAIGQSLSQGALDQYATAGVPYANFVTAGDSRVCPTCADAEGSGPYLLADCPQPPMHVRCRCTVAPADFFLTGASS